MMSRFKKIVGFTFCLFFFACLIAMRPAVSQNQFMTPSGMNVQTGPSYAPPSPQAEALRDPDPGNIFFLPAARTLPKGKFNIAVGRPIVTGVY